MNKIRVITLIISLIFLTNCNKADSTTGVVIRIEPDPDIRAREFED
jgi:hypothetical protein